MRLARDRPFMMTIGTRTANYLDLYGTGAIITAAVTITTMTVAYIVVSTYKFGSCYIFWHLGQFGLILYCCCLVISRPPRLSRRYVFTSSTPGDRLPWLVIDRNTRKLDERHREDNAILLNFMTTSSLTASK